MHYYLIVQKQLLKSLLLVTEKLKYYIIHVYPTHISHRINTADPRDDRENSKINHTARSVYLVG